MFEKLKDFFAGSEKEPASLKTDQAGKATDADLQVACAVLLVEMARADKSVARQEGQAVVALMAVQFGIPEDRMPALIETAMAARKAQGKLDEFVRCINQGFSASQKQRLLAMIWKVVLADGSVDKYEERLAVQMKSRLQLSDEQAVEARRMAESGTL